MTPFTTTNGGWDVESFDSAFHLQSEQDWPTGLSLPAAVMHCRRRNNEQLSANANRDRLREKREHEFAAGRACAHRLLADAGCHDPVGVNVNRSPAWPSGFVGSISHSERWIWAAISSGSKLKSIGIDTEPVVTPQTRQSVEAEIASPAEWNVAQSLGFSHELTFSLVFSAKEAFYKCWYPLTGNFFGFEDAIVEDATPNSIRIGNAASNPNWGHCPDALDVQFQIDGDDVFTIAWIDQEASA